MMTGKKFLLLFILLLISGCNEKSVERGSLPNDYFLIIAHRGASAYAPAHTIASYDLAVKWEQTYIEIDLHRTVDGKLVALHDPFVLYEGGQMLVSNSTFDELNRFSPGKEFNKKYPVNAQLDFENLRIPDIEQILSHFDGTANFYIEIKSPISYPGIEEELLEILRKYDLLNNKSEIPKVIIQSFDENSLKRIFELDSSIPLVQLYSFPAKANLNSKDLEKLAAICIRSRC